MRNKINSENYKIGTPIWKYARMVEERRGHNYQYLSDQKWDELEKKGYKFWDFGKGKTEILSEALARGIVIMLRSQGNYARVIVGREQNQQRVKMFSVIYKLKKE